jgi:ATP-binding cassette subfamily C protein EexD
MLTPALYMLQLYDRVVTSKSFETLVMLTLIVLFVYLFLFLFDYFRHKITTRLANRFDNIFDEDIFKSLFKWSTLEPNKANTTPLKDLFQIRQFISSNVLLAFFDLPWILLYVAVLFLFHPLFGWFALGSIIILVIIATINEKTTKKLQEESNGLHSKQMEMANSFLKNSEVINSMGILNNVQQIHTTGHNKWLETQTNTNDKSTFFVNLTKYLRTLLQSLILGLGAYLVIKAEVSPGMMIAGSIILGRILAPIDVLIAQSKQVILSKEAFNRIKQLLNDTKEAHDKTKLPDIVGNISLENITTTVPASNKIILNNINLNFEPGTVSCILGESGSGKSTLIRTLLGLWESTSGKVSIDGAEIKQYSQDILGNAIGYLPQDVELFDGTIAQNIAQMGEIDEDLLLSATKLCDTHELIVNLPNGYDTKIGKNGIILSGGQKQRIAIARALYNNPKIVILDEPNSNLDDKGDLALVKTIQRLKASNTTVILITHKLNIVQYVDNVILIKKGQVSNRMNTQEFFENLNGKKGQK